MERITLLVHSASVAIVEAGTLEDRGGVDIGLVRPSVLSCGSRLSLCLSSSPFGRQDALAFGEIVESSVVVMEPEEELQVLGRMLNVLEVVHEVTNGAWLAVGVSLGCLNGLSQQGIDNLTGQVPLLMMLSKDKASGIPALLPELPEVCDSVFCSPAREAVDELTCAGRR